MIAQEVFDMARLFAAGDEDEEILMSLCEVAVQELLGRLKAGLLWEDCMPAFAIAASWIALDYLASGEDVTSFSAGDFSVTQKGQSGERRKNGEALMRPYLSLSDFAFCSVKG